MKLESALKLQPGDSVWIKPLWNNTTRARKHRIDRPTQVVCVTECEGCETGALIEVRKRGGSYAELDAAWFDEPEDKTDGERA
jgi:hypothetical protein